MDDKMINEITEIICKSEESVRYANLSETFSTLMSNYEDVITFDTERSRLAGMQYESASQFLGINPELHEEYHQASIKLQAGLRNFHSSYKTFLNSYTLVLKRKLPLDIQNQMKSTTSVGKFLTSFQKVINKVEKSKEKKTLKKILNKLKNAYVLAEYRSTSLEHPELSGHKSPNVLGGLSDTPQFASTSANRNIKKEEHEEIPLKEFTPPDEPHINVMVVGTDVYVHYVPYDFKEGDEFKKGDPVMAVKETWEEHFNKYGVHSHFYPDMKGGTPQVVSLGEFENFSPTIDEVIVIVKELVLSTEKRLKNIKR